jgi:2-methylcitrate dehydratase PrpD
MKRRDFCRSSILAAGSAFGSPAKLSAGESGTVEFPASPGLTRYVSEFIVDTHYENIPPDVITLGKKSILDGFGLALAGSVSTLAPLMKQYIEGFGTGTGKSHVIGTNLNLPPRFAAFANGSFIHADDYDDTQLAVAKDRVYGLLTHPTVPVLPPAFALCESEGRSGRELLTAYHVGVEVECKIAEAISPRHYTDGFHTTGTVGVFGSASACAKLRGLDAAKTAFALGIAAAEAGGLRENFGSMTKPFHAGHAAEAGVVAADLAALGWTAAPNILEAQFGFFHAAGGGFDPGAIMNRLGKPWTLVSPGVSIKPYPSGSLTHPAMGEMMRLIRQYDIKPAEVDKVNVGGNNGMVTTLLHHNPNTGLQGKFSMEFGIAILLLERRAGLAEYTDAVVGRPDVQEMIRRVNFYVDPEAEQAGLDKMTSILKVHMKDGRVLSGRAQFAKGSPANPMSYEEVADKFRGCATFARWSSQNAEAVIEFVRSIEAAPDVRKLTANLAVSLADSR